MSVLQKFVRQIKLLIFELTLLLRYERQHMEQQGHLKNKNKRKKTQRYDSSGAIRKHRKVQTAEYACLLIIRGTTNVCA